VPNTARRQGQATTKNAKPDRRWRASERCLLDPHPGAPESQALVLAVLDPHHHSRPRAGVEQTGHESSDAQILLHRVPADNVGALAAAPVADERVGRGREPGEAGQKQRE
jgi:hypothetical protein